MITGLPLFGALGMAAFVLGAAFAAPSMIDLVHRFLGPPVARIFGAPGRVALAGLARARRRSGVAAGAVLIGIALVMCLDTFASGSFPACADHLDRPAAIPADLFVVQGANTIGIMNTPMDKSVGDLIESVPGVQEVQPVRLVWTDLLGNHVGLYGIKWDRYIRHSRPIFTEGDTASVTADMERGGVMLSDNLVRKVGVHRGDHITINTAHGPRDFVVAGVEVDYSSDRGTVTMDLDTFRQTFNDEKVDSWDTYVKKGADVQTVRKGIEAKLTSNADIRVFSNAELRKAVFVIIDDFFGLVYALLFIAVAVGVLGVVGTLLAQVLDRTRELGIIRAMGASRGQILASVAIEATLLALAGSLLGIPVGCLLGRVFVDVIGVQSTGWVFPPVYPIGFGLIAALVSIAFAGLGGLFPAQRAASLDVVEAIGYESGKNGPHSAPSALAPLTWERGVRQRQDLGRMNQSGSGTYIVDLGRSSTRSAISAAAALWCR